VLFCRQTDRQTAANSKGDADPIGPCVRRGVCPLENCATRLVRTLCLLVADVLDSGSKRHSEFQMAPELSVRSSSSREGQGDGELCLHV
jgi:hypothetical protein